MNAPSPLEGEGLVADLLGGHTTSELSGRSGANRNQHRERGGVQLACVAPNVDWGVSLTHFYLAEDIVRQPLPIHDGAVSLPARPGLGIEVDEAAVERLRVSDNPVLKGKSWHV